MSIIVIGKFDPCATLVDKFVIIFLVCEIGRQDRVTSVHNECNSTTLYQLNWNIHTEISD